MGSRKIRRMNCIYGWWMYPDSQKGPEKLTLAEVAARYASQTEGKKVTPDDFRTLGYEFEYDDPKQSGQHGVMGTMHLNWTLRSRR